jgi:uncharacterized protein
VVDFRPPNGTIVSMHYPRNLTAKLEKSLTRSPAVLLDGARQTGKSTLVKQIGKNLFNAKYVSLDEPEQLAGAIRSPATFVDDLSEHVIIDEIQRAPEIFLPLKKSIDEHRKPGRFLLLGSANVLMLPRLSESLVGRLIIHTLQPLSQGELQDRLEDFVDAAFASTLPLIDSSINWKQLIRRICVGGYPEIVSAAGTDMEFAREWFSSYVRTLIERDVREISQVDSLRTFPQLLSVLSQRAAMPANFAEVGRICGIAKTSLLRYISLLESLFVISFIPAWFANRETRLIKSAKLIFTDGGLHSYIARKSLSLLQEDRSAAGPIVENFVGAELIKQLSWSKTNARLYHFRTQDGKEVDFVLEDDRGRLVGVEVKCANTIHSSDIANCNALQEACGSRLLRCIVLYTGAHSVRLAKNIIAMPISALWDLNWKKAYNVFAKS